MKNIFKAGNIKFKKMKRQKTMIIKNKRKNKKLENKLNKIKLKTMKSIHHKNKIF